MSSKNPVLKNLPGVESQHGYGYEQGFDAPASQRGGVQGERPMTIDDVTTKTGITLAVIIATALVSFWMWATQNPLAPAVTLGGAIAAFIVVLVHAFGSKFGSPTLTLLYAAFEGLFLGGFSFIISGAANVGGSDAGAMIGQAILGTVGVFIGMLVVYRTGAIRVTPRFNRILTGVIFGVCLLYTSPSPRD